MSRTPGGLFRRQSRMTRQLHASSSVEAVVLIAVATILVTRLVLHISDYPRVGGASLHIAHVLWGGLGLTAASLVALSLTGRRARAVTIVLAGLGLGLFLDEVGKFVTTTNDYFYKPAVAIMYAFLAIIVVVARGVRDLLPRRPHEELTAAIMIVADGLTHGVTSHQRTLAYDLLSRAQQSNEFRAQTIDSIDTLLRSCQTADTSSRLRDLWAGVTGWSVFSTMERPRWVRVVAVALVGYSAVGVVSALRAASTIGDDVAQFATGVDAVGSALALILAVPALWSQTPRTWALELLRLSCLFTVVLVQVVEFAESQFSAVANTVVGLAALALVSHHIRLRRQYIE